MISKISRSFRSVTGLGLWLFVFLLANALFLGPSDDEAYYWSLAQNPQAAYAFHPPLVAWLIGLSQILFGWIAGENSNLVLRAPAVLGATLSFWIVLRWIGSFESATHPVRAAWTFLSLAGVFVLGWMMVPDISLLTGLALLFTVTWSVQERGITGCRFLVLALAAFILLLSKYSGILAVASSLFCIWFWAPQSSRWRATGALFLGSLLALAPVLYWNWQNDWGSLAYQLKDRHGGEVNWVRLARFWGIQIAAVGPLVFYTFRLRGTRLDHFAAVWTIPALLVFGIQPLIGEFKPHWALVIWFVSAMRLSAHAAQGMAKGWARAHRIYGSAVGAVALILLHFPIITLLTKQPKLDIGNDLVGWSELSRYLESENGQDFSEWVIVGSRYQTASRAYFERGPSAKVVLLPRDQKQLHEWDDFGVTDSTGPEWPKLIKPVLFVTDNRYTAGPEFRDARCVLLKRAETKRMGQLARWIEIQACYPVSM